MAFDQTEITIIQRGKELGKTREEVERAILKYRTSKNAPTAIQEKTILEKVSGGLDTVFGGGAIGEAIGSQLAKFTEGGRMLRAQEKAGLVPEGTVAETFKGPSGKELLFDVGQAALTVGTGGLGGFAVKAATPVVKGGIIAVEKAAAPVISGVKELTTRGGQKIASIPERIGTNVAEMKAQTEAIKSLPTKTAQDAVRSGIDILDVKDIVKIPTIVKPDIKKFTDNLIAFSKRESDVDPIEFVGKPIVSRIKTLEKTRQTVGAKLGEVSKNLGIVTKAELEVGVGNALKKAIPGLAINKGKLDFSRTAIASNLAESTASRKAIQNAYNNAVKWGDGEKAHLFRQELFEILGGKKRATQLLTDSDEKALEAIRKGLSDVLETKNPQYKKLSSQYRAVMKPLTDIRKKIKAVDPTVTEDILDMNAGILARRLTGTSVSRGELIGLLKQLDSVSKTKGNTLEKTMALQNTYNILRKYYDIDPKTGFIGLTKSAVEEGGGITGALMGGGKKLAGETIAVRQQALEKLLSELLR